MEKLLLKFALCFSLGAPGVQESLSFESQNVPVKGGRPSMDSFQEMVAFWMYSRQKNLRESKPDIERVLGQRAVVELGKLVKQYLPERRTNFEGQSRIISGHKTPELLVSSEGRYVAQRNGDVRVWDMQDQQAAPMLFSENEHRFITAMAFSPDSQQLGLAYYDPDVFRLLDIQSGEVTYELPVEQRCSRITFGPNGDCVGLCMGNSRNNAYALLIDRGTGAIRRRFDTGCMSLSINFAPTGNFFALGKYHEADLYDVVRLEDEPQRVQANSSERILFSPDGNAMVCHGISSVLTVLNVHSLGEEPIMVDDLGMAPVYDISFSPKSDLVAIASSDGSLVCDIKKKVVRPIDQDFAISSTFSLDGKYLLSRLRDKNIKVIDVAQPKNTVLLSGEEFEDLKFLPSGTHFITSSLDKGLKIRDWSLIEQKMNQKNADEQKD